MKEKRPKAQVVTKSLRECRVLSLFRSWKDEKKKIPIISLRRGKAGDIFVGMGFFLVHLKPDTDSIAKSPYFFFNAYCFMFHLLFRFPPDPRLNLHAHNHGVSVFIFLLPLTTEYVRARILGIFTVS